MAKIDVSGIEGFDKMSAEEKVQVLMGIDVPDAPDMSGFVTKELFDRTASELASAKKSLKSKMTEDETAEEERKKAMESLQNEVDTLKKEKTVASYKAEFLGLGYDEKTAAETAKALADGDMSKVFTNQKAFLESQKKVIQAEALKKQPELSGGTPPNKETLEQQEVAKLRQYMGL